MDRAYQAENTRPAGDIGRNAEQRRGSEVKGGGRGKGKVRAQSKGRERERMEVMNRVREPNAKQREYAEQREGAEAGHGPGGKWRARLDTAENKPNTDARPYLRVIRPEKLKCPIKMPDNAVNTQRAQNYKSKSYKIEREPWQDWPPKVCATTLTL